MSDQATTGLSVRGLTVRYGGVVANDDVSIDVPGGSVVGLIGPNGAGKSTFVDAVTGFTASTGAVRLDGSDLATMPTHLRRRAGLSRTWQSGELFGNLTVLENVLAASTASGPTQFFRDLFLPRGDQGTEVAMELLARLGIDSDAHTVTRSLPLGRQKLVGVARALVGTVSTVLLDEPAAGLDTNESIVLGRRIKDVAAAGPGVLLIDHDVSLVLSVCDSVYVLDFGRILFHGSPEDAHRDPTVVAAYLGAPLEASE